MYASSWFKRRFCSQYTAGFAMMMASASSGTFTGWATAILPIFQSPDWPIPMDQSQIAWVLSIHFLGNILGAVPAGIFMDKFGRKFTLLIAGFTLPLTSWALVFVSTAGSLYHVEFDTVSNHGNLSAREFHTVSIPDNRPMYHVESDTVSIPDSMYHAESDTESISDSILYPRLFDTVSFPGTLFPQLYDSVSTPKNLYPIESHMVSNSDNLNSMESSRTPTPDNLYTVSHDTVETPGTIYLQLSDTVSTPSSLYSEELDTVSTFGSLDSMKSKVSTSPDGWYSMKSTSESTPVISYPMESNSNNNPSITESEISNSPTFWYVLLLARLICGIWNGVVTTVSPIYLAEIAEPNCRGRLNTLVSLFFRLGNLLAILASLVFSHKILPIVLSLSTVVFLLVFPSLPETPYYLVKQGEYERAGKSLKRLRSTKLHRTRIEMEEEGIWEEIEGKVERNIWREIEEEEVERKIWKETEEEAEKNIWGEKKGGIEEREIEEEVGRKIWKETEEEVDKKIWGETERGIKAKVWRKKCLYDIEMVARKWSKREGDMKEKVREELGGEIKDEEQKGKQGEVKGKICEATETKIEAKMCREKEGEIRIKVWEDSEEIDTNLETKSEKELQENIGTESRINETMELNYLDTEKTPEKRTDIETNRNNKLDSKFEGEIEVKPALEEKTIIEKKLVKISRAETQTESSKFQLRRQLKTIPEVKIDEELLHKELKSIQESVTIQTELQRTKFNIPEVKLDEELLHKELKSIQEAVAKQMELQETTLLQKLRSKTTIKSLFIVETLSILLRMAGIAPIINYVADSLPGSEIFNPNFFVLSIEVTRLLSSLLSSVVVDRLPRRTLLIGTSMVCGCSMTLMTSFYLFDDFQKQNLSSLGINDHVEYMTNDRDLTEVTTQFTKFNANQSDIVIKNSRTISLSSKYNVSGISKDNQYKNGVNNSRTIFTSAQYTRNLSGISENSQYNHGVDNSRAILLKTKYNLSEISGNSQYKNGVNSPRTIVTSKIHNQSGISENSQYKNEVNNSRTISTSAQYNLSGISDNSQYNHGVDNSGAILLTTKYNLSKISGNSQYKNGVNNSRTILTSTKYNLSRILENIQTSMNGENNFENFTKIEDTQNKLSENIPKFLKFLPLTCIIIHGISFSFGVATVCSNIRSELFPMNVKGHCSAITSIVTAMTSFGLSRSFPMTRNFMGLWFNFGIYAVSSFLIALFAKLYLPETSGKTLQEIQDELETRKSEKMEERSMIIV